MAWGIVIAFPMVFGMLMLVFAVAGDGGYQTFGRTTLNPPELPNAEAEPQELKKAA